jgi:hypothetical protein
MLLGSGLQDKAPVAIRTLDEIVLAHFEINLGMAQRAAHTLAGHAGIFDFDDFGHFDGHGVYFYVVNERDHIGRFRARKRLCRNDPAR